MRSLFLFIAFMQLSCFLFGQESAVPKSVIRAFKHQYHSSESSTWYVEPQHYEVHFLDGRQEKIAFYAKSGGELMQTKELIDEKEIPNEVMQAIRGQYLDFALDDYSRVVRPDGSVFFSISLRSSGGRYDIEYSVQGAVLREERAH